MTGFIKYLNHSKLYDLGLITACLRPNSSKAIGDTILLGTNRVSLNSFNFTPNIENPKQSFSSIYVSKFSLNEIYKIKLINDNFMLVIGTVSGPILLVEI